MNPRFLYAFIGSHGITDLSLPTDIWVPIYSLSCLYGAFIPYKLLVGISYLFSWIHFTMDIGVSWVTSLGYAACLSGLIYCRKRTWSPKILLGYMSVIHTPLHLYRHLSFHNVGYVIALTCFLSYYKPYHRCVSRIIYQDGLLQNTYLHRALLIIINGHIMTHVLLAFTYLHPNNVNYYLCTCING